MSVSQQKIEKKLQKWKSNLIDLTKRNRLLNFKQSPSSTLRLEETEELFGMLQNEKSLYVRRFVDLQKIKFKTNKKDAKNSAVAEEADELDLLFEEDENDEKAVKEAKLEMLLNKIRLKAKSSIDEKGINVLYVAFGFLKWFESEDAKDPLISPLLLVPVELARVNSKELHYILRYDDEIVVNPTLIHKLRIDFGIELPSIPDDSEQEIKIAEFLGLFKNAIHGMRNWQVTEEAFLGLFSFSKLIMYNDFEQYGDLLKNHPMIKELSGVSEQRDSWTDSFEPIEVHDRKSKSVDSFQILDADSSQQEAILAAKSGLNFVLQGPPGTGKSQTISNIIAESLAQGKKVLFVSDKMAALEVVKRRLDEQGVGDFCLELHSHNTNKKTVLEELSRTLHLRQSSKSKSMNFPMLDNLKNHLNTYVDALHIVVQPLGFKPQYVHGLLGKLYDVAELTFSVPEIEKFNAEQFDKTEKLLHKLVQRRELIGNYNSHLWQSSLPKRFTLELQSNISSKFVTLSDQFAAVLANLRTSTELLSVDWEHTIATLKKILYLAELSQNMPKVPVGWLRNSSSPNLESSQQQSQKYAALFAEFREKSNKMLKEYQQTVLDLDLEDIRHTLTSKYENELKPFINSYEKFVPSLLQNQPEIVRQLDELYNALSLMAENEKFNKDVLGITLSKFGIEDLWSLMYIYSKILESESPATVWFDGSNRDALVSMFKEARTKFEEYSTELQQLTKKYDLDILQLDVEGILKRYITDYSSFLRFMKGSYRKEAKLLRFHLKEKGKVPYEEALRDLKLAARVKEKQQWIQEKESVHKQWFGPKFQGSDTDWQKLEQNMNAVFHLCEALANLGLSEKFIQYVQNLNEQQRLGLRDRSEKLANVYGKLQEKITATNNFFVFVSPFDDKEASFLTLYDNVAVARKHVKEIIQSKDQLLKLSTSRIKSMKDLLSDIDIILGVKKIKGDIEQDHDKLTSMFGELFNGFETDWDSVFAALDWANSIKEIFNSDVTLPYIHMIQDSNGKLKKEFIDLAVQLGKQWNGCRVNYDFYQTIFPIDAETFDGKVLEHANLTLVITKLMHWADQSFKLEEWIEMRTMMDDAETLGMGDFIAQVLESKLPEQDSLSELFLKRFYKLWLDYAYTQQEVLNGFRSDQFDKLIGQFKEMDRNQFNINGGRIDQILTRKKEAYLEGNSFRHPQLNVLNREINKQKRHKPIRRLFSEIPDLLWLLKPCLMMSPMSVSQFIDPNLYEFDVVIFDEASQIGSEDAIGSIFRGKQLIIGGDSKQLPPTRFFGTSTDAEDEDEEDEEINDIYESILDECSVFLPERQLKWHYRSRDESLIAFSNREIYDNSLYTFPSSSSGGNDGVSFVYVENGVYDRSGSRNNKNEAKKVAELVIEHFRKTPERTLGVIAFSEAQQEAIRTYVEHYRNEHPEIDHCFNENNHESFFVKNLENVQGDERDTIIFSVGYGKDQDGSLYYNFGPLNKPGGERRLNVAVTRAKHEIKLVSSIKHTDLSDSKLNKKGPQLLKAYLYYASTGGEFDPNRGIQNGGEFDSPFEEDVYNMLVARGLQLVPQVGCSSYRIDLAVVDPNNPGRYLLGIECDGAMYHSSKTARDRDRLRQQVLESLGWKIHRIWSQNWFKHKREEIDKIVTLVDSLAKRNRTLV